MTDLQNAISGLSNKQKDKIFDEGKKFMSLEVIYPKTANVVPYDKSLYNFMELLNMMLMVHRLVRKEVVRECWQV